MKSKAIEILRAIADDNNNNNHSSLSLGYQAAVKVALSELAQPEPEIANPLLEAINAQIKRVIDERLETALNRALDEHEQRIHALEDGDLAELQSRMDELDKDVVSLDGRIDELECWQNNMDDDDNRNEIESRIDDLESAKDEHEDAIDSLNKLVVTLQDQQNNATRAAAVACIDLIREKLA
jgi:uncharacterized coiled-coil protein SlyX